MAKKNNDLIYGKHPVIDSLKSGQSFDKVLLQQGIRGELEKEVRQLCKQFEVPLQIVPKEKLNKLTGGNHQGIIGFISSIVYQKIENVLPLIYERSETPLLLILDGVTDVRNFGAIARTAAGTGVQAIIIPRKGGALINADALKTSAGALTKIPVCRENSLEETVEFLHNSGVQVFASDLSAEKMLFDLDFSQPAAIVMGSEGKGVNPHLLRQIQHLFIIPQTSLVDSFNVSVATGIVLYEALRQRTLFATKR